MREFLVTLALLLIAAVPARADIVYDNFISCTPGTQWCAPSGDSYYSHIAWPVGEIAGTEFPDVDAAMAFTPLTDYTFDTFELAISLTELGDPNVLDISLVSDDNGRPGVVMETIRLVDAMPQSFAGENNDGTLVPLVVGSSATHPVLQANIQYWLVASVDSPTSAAWWFNGTRFNQSQYRWGRVAQGTLGGSWPDVFPAQPGAFRITGTLWGGEGDPDNDGIDSFIDGRIVSGSFVDESLMFSNEFTDQHFGAKEFGSILDRGGLFVQVQFLPPTIDRIAALRVTTSPGIGPALMQACLVPSLGDPRAAVILSFPAGKSAIINCSSLNLQVLVGPIEILLGDDVVAAVPTGATAKVTELGDGQFDLRNETTSTGPIVVQVPGGVIELGPGESLGRPAIDVKPGGVPNLINLRKEGVIPVAILTTPSFDATTVDALSVCFGDAEDDSQRDCTEAHGTGHLEDVDGDLDLDLVLHYEALETGIDLGDTEACLTGETTDGDLIAGCDLVAPKSGGPARPGSLGARREGGSDLTARR